jgi:hypothetical protein
MSDDLESLSGPRGLAPGEKVPNPLRILAMQENLGRLHAVHRPATRLARLTLKEARIYLYDKGLVISSARGTLALYRWEQCTVVQKAGTWLVSSANRAKVPLTKHWTEYEELGRAVEQAVAQAAG